MEPHPGPHCICIFESGLLFLIPFLSLKISQFHFSLKLYRIPLCLCFSYLSVAVIKYQDENQLRVEGAYFDLGSQRDRVHCYRKGMTTVKETVVAGAGSWLMTFPIHTQEAVREKRK